MPIKKDDSIMPPSFLDPSFPNQPGPMPSQLDKMIGKTRGEKRKEYKEIKYSVFHIS